jgi:hypothetical protein
MPDPISDAFQRALAEAGRKDRARNDEGVGLRGGARIRGVAFGSGEGSGGKARFGHALDWTEPADRPAPPQVGPTRRPAERSSGETSVEIATEFGLDSALTLDQLTYRWRDFVWRNHPDRQPADARERANGRVAIANTLYDRARAEFVRRR